MMNRVLHRAYHLFIILTLVVSIIPSVMPQEFSPVRIADKAEAASPDDSAEKAISSNLEVTSNGGGTNPSAPGRPNHAPADVECMVRIDGAVFLNAGPSSYPTSFYPVDNAEVQDPAWVNREISDLRGFEPRISYSESLVLYFAIQNVSEIFTDCDPAGNDVVLREVEIWDRDTGYSQIWNLNGTPSNPAADPLINLFWSSGTAGTLNRGGNAWGLLFFDADQISTTTGRVHFNMLWRMDSCTPTASNGGSCDGAVGPIIGAPLGYQGDVILAGPRAQLAFIQPLAGPTVVNPNDLVTYVLQASPPPFGVQTPDIVSVAGDPASLPDCANGTFTDGNPYGWYNGPDPQSATLIDNMALNPPIQTDGPGPSGVYYCYFQVEMDSALADPVTGEFILEGDVVFTDVNNVSLTLHVVAPPVVIAIPDVTVTKTIISPANPNQGVSIGDTITYEIVIRNTGEISLNQISAIDSLTGPIAIPPGTTLAVLDPDTGTCPQNQTCEITLTTSYVVRVNDPSTLVNTVTVNAHLNLVGVNDIVSDSAAASIRVISDDLQVALVLTSVDGAPYNATTNPPQPGSVLVFTTQYDNRGTVNLRDLQYVTGYPTYVDAPAPTYVNSVIGAGDIFPGLYGDSPSESASTFTYTVPSSFPADPIYQRIRVRAFRPNNTAVFAEALLIVDLTNPNVSITATRYLVDGSPISQSEAALRGDTLYFSGTITNESALPICGIEIRQYIRNPITGQLTPGNPYLIPASNITWPAGQPANSLAASGDPQGRDVAAFTGVTYQVNSSTPDPLDIVFEVYAPLQGSPTCNTLAEPLVDRTSLTVDISDVQISSFIQARLNNNIVTYGLYPPPELTYRFIYGATNVGGTQFTITNIGYCVEGYPIPCTSTFPNTLPNFRADSNDNVFTPFQTRVDEFTITLLAAEAETYSNPLRVQVILNGRDIEGRNVIVRTLLEFPLISSELPGTLTGPLNDRALPADRIQDSTTSLVRGDADVPFQFTFENQTGTVLENVYIVNLLETSASPQVGYYQVGAYGFNAYYELCDVTNLTSGVPILQGPNTMQPDDVISGTCRFTYSDSMPAGQFQMQVLAVGNRVIDPNQRLISVVTWGIREVPHLRVSKLAPGSAVATQSISYTIEIYNQSMYQYVDFNPATAFTDVIQPDLPASTLQPSNFGIANFPSLQSVPGGLYRLPIAPNGNSPAVGTYQRVPPGGEFPDTSYRNDVTVFGTAQSGFAVSATASATVAITCPLDMDAAYSDIPGDIYSTTNEEWTLGERARLTFLISNISNVDVTLTHATDELYNRENGLTTGSETYPDHPESWTWMGTPGVIPAGGIAIYQYDAILRPVDFPNGIDPQPITFTTSVQIANPPPGCDPFSLLWIYRAPNPVSIDKVVAPSLVFPGGTATYDIQLENISEGSDIQVTRVEDNLLSPSPMIMDFSSTSPDGPSGQLNEYGPNPATDDNTAVLVQNGQQNYVVQADDPETVTNIAIVYYYPINGPQALPSTINVGPFVPMDTGPTQLLSNRTSASISTGSPLACIMQPSQTDVAAGGNVDILITLVNNSAEYDITGVQFTIADETGTLILSDQSVGIPDPLDLSQANRQFTINVTYTVPAGWSNPTLRIDCTARGIFSFTNAMLPDTLSSIRLNVAAPELVVEMVVFQSPQGGNPACPYVDGADADSLLDDPDTLSLLPDVIPPSPTDGIGEATVGSTVYYGILIQNTSLGLLYRNLAIAQASLNNGASLEADASAQLTSLLPALELGPGEQVILCVPYQIVDRLADPLIHTLIVSTESVTASNPTGPGTALELQAVAAVDVQDTNIRIFKTALPTVSFPGEVVTYTLYIENMNVAGADTLDAALILDDVWDSILGGPLSGASYCGNTSPIPVNIPPANFGVCDPSLTSIPFNDLVAGGDPNGWLWPDPTRPGVLLEGEHAIYTYQYTVQEVDPNPLINTAGVRAVLYDANSDPNPANWDVQIDLNNDPILAIDETLASVAITDSQLLVIKQAPASALAGSEVEYTLTVINIGDIEVANVEVRDDQYNLQNGLGVNAALPYSLCNFDASASPLEPQHDLVCRYTLTMPTAAEIEMDPSQDPFRNTVVATGEISNGGQLVPIPNNGSDVAIVDILVPGVSLDKIPSVGSAAIGDTVTYTVEVQNTGSLPLRIDQLVDVPPAGPPPTITINSLHVGSADPNARCDDTGNPVTVPVVLAVGEIACGDISLVITNPAPATEYVNTVRVYATADPNGANPISLVDSTSAIVTVRNLGLVVEKLAYNCDPLVCANPQVITTIGEGVDYFYGITVTNTGDAPIDMIEWRDPLYQSNNWQQLVNAFDDLSNPTDTAALDVNETLIVASYPFQAIYATHGPLLTNRVDVRGREEISGTFTPIRSDTSQVFILPTALQITKRACVDVTGSAPANFNPCPANTPAAVRPGGTVWYEVTITNPSPTVTVTEVEVTDSLVGPWTTGPTTLGPNETQSWVYQGAPVSGALTTVVNTATVTAVTNGSPISRSASASVPVVIGDLLVLITEDNGISTAQVGDVLNFTVLVQNLSATDTITNINVSVPFYSPDFLNTAAFDLLPGATSTPFTFQYTVTPADNTMVFTAIAQGFIQSNFLTAQSSWTVNRSANGLVVTKTANTNYAAVNDTIYYTITITNDSGFLVDNLIVTDSLLEGLPSWPTDWPSSIPTGESVTRTIPYVVQEPIPSNPILNTVTVTGDVLNNPPASITTTVQAGPVAVFIPDGNLLVTNTPSALDAVVGDILTFTYRICNLADGTPPNDQPITSISLIDNLGPLPLGADFSLDPGECFETARTGVQMLASDVPVYTMSVTGSGAQFQGGTEVALSQTVSRDVNVREPGQDLVFTVDAVPNPILYTGANVPVAFNFTLQNVGTTTLTIQSIADNSPGTPIFTGYNPLPTAVANRVLSPGEILTFVGTPAYLADNTPDPILGIWTVTATTPTNTTLTATADISIPIVTNANAMVIIEQVSMDPPVAVPGGIVTYTYVIRNISEDAQMGVRLLDGPATNQYCTWTALDSPTNPVGPGANPLWELLPAANAVLPVGGQATAQATCLIDIATPLGSMATHDLQVALATPLNETNPSLVVFDVQDEAVVSTLVQAPLAVSAPTSAFSSNPATPITAWRVGAGYAVDISFDITNTSNSLQITGVTPTMTVDGTGVCTGGFTFNPATFNGTLAPNATVTAICANYVPTAGLMPVATVGVSAEGFVQGIDVIDIGSADFDVYNLGFTLELTVDPTSADVGETVNFTLTLRNTGATQTPSEASPLYLPPAAEIPITSARLDNLLVDDILGDIYAALQSACFSGGPLAPGATCTLAYDNAALTNNELTYTIVQADPNTISFMLSIRLWSSATNPAFEIENNDTVDVTVSRPAINAYGLTANPNPGVVGNQIAFTANIQNSGTQALENLTATLQLTQLSFTNAVGDSDSIVLTGGHNQTPLPLISMIINDADGVLNPGEVATAIGYWQADRVGTFRATLTASGLAENTQITATDTELLEFRINSSAIPTVTPSGLTPTATTATTDPDGNPLDPTALDPTVAKTVTPESALPGQDVTFTVTITNGSTTPMANITMTDNMPLELTINNATTSVGASVVSGQLITVTTGQLNPGERITVVITARVNDDVSIPSLITNDACAAATGRTQVCATVELPIGADAGALPTTGMGEPDAADLDIATQGVAGNASRPFGLAPLLMLGLLALLSTGQINRQRWVLGGIAVLIIATIAGALVLVGSGDDENDTTGTPQLVLPPGVTATASPTLDRAPTLTPLGTQESLGSPVAPTPLDAPPTLRPSPTPYIPPTPSGERRIDIPRLNFTSPVPIVELTYSDAAWDVSNLGHSVGWLEKTTWMAPTWGNTVLVAHVQLANDDPGPFKRLNELEVGDDIYVYDGAYEYAFRVTEISTVNATAIEVTHPTVDPVLTLLTCTNWDFARGVYADRLVIRAEPVVN